MIGSPGWAAQDEELLAGLRARGLYELAEKYCTDLLSGELDEPRRANLSIELSRTLAEHALDAPPGEAPNLWRQATEVLERFAIEHPRYPRMVLVKLQGALALAAQGRAAREDAEGAPGEDSQAAAREILRRAISELRELDGQIETQLRERGPRERDGGLTAPQLQSLQLSLRHQLGRALVDQAESYPPASPDRISALGQAAEVLASVTRQNLQTPLVYSAMLEEIACWRLLGEYPAAEKRLGQLDKVALPEGLAQRLRAERIELALARGHVDEALSEAGAARGDKGPDAALARLEALVAAWQRAGERRNAEESADWQRRAVEQAKAIGASYGSRRMRHAERLLAGAMAEASGVQTAETLAYAAASYFRGGQLDKALATYDEAARRALDGGQSDQARQLAFTAATIEKERGNYGEALKRYRRLAVNSPQADRAAEAHLLAVYCAAQLAQIEKPPRLDEYESLLREHVDTWPNSPTTSQAWCWLGRLAEHEHEWQRAVELLSHVERGDPQYAEASEALGRCYEAWLDELVERGEAPQRLANQALSRLEEIAASGKPHVKPDAATRAATLAAARIWLKNVPNGALPAERLLRGALDHDAAASDAWKASARMLLVPALAAQGRGAQADAMIDELPDDPTAMLRLLELLSELRRRAEGDAARRYAQVALAVQSDLLNRASALDGDTLRAVRREHGITLAETGRRKEGLEALQALAREFPRDGQTHEDLATVLAAGNPADTRAALAKWGEVASRSRPGTPRWFRSHYGLASTQFKLGQVREARATIEAVAAKYPDFDRGAMQGKYERLRAETAGR